MAQPMQQQHAVRAILDRNGEPKFEAVVLGRTLKVGQQLEAASLVETLDERGLQSAALHASRL